MSASALRGPRGRDRFAQGLRASAVTIPVRAIFFLPAQSIL